jgi:hypothetical protein
MMAMTTSSSINVKARRIGRTRGDGSMASSEVVRQAHH